MSTKLLTIASSEESEEETGVNGSARASLSSREVWEGAVLMDIGGIRKLALDILRGKAGDKRGLTLSATAFRLSKYIGELFE